MGGGGHNKVPDRWEAYSNLGSILPGTNIVAFKVPLRHGIQRNVADDVAVWGLKELQQALPALSLVVDLTATARYYDPHQLSGVRHCKILTRGQELPSERVVHQFYRAMASTSETDLVGVHCTHGLNRTGYLVCRFLVEKRGWQPEEAIRAFDEARGHKQERENYLADLRARGWEGRRAGQTTAAAGREEGARPGYRDCRQGERRGWSRPDSSWRERHGDWREGSYRDNRDWRRDQGHGCREHNREYSGSSRDHRWYNSGSQHGLQGSYHHDGGWEEDYYTRSGGPHSSYSFAPELRDRDWGRDRVRGRKRSAR